MMREPSGFTLIELMIVTLVIGILAAIAIPNFIGMQGRAREGATKSNMHTLQLMAEDYCIQNAGTYSATLDATHIADQLPVSFRNPFDGSQGAGNAWEDRATFAAPATAKSGISSYADSASLLYNIKGHGKSAPISLTLTSGL